MPSFDVSSDIDWQELDNAIQQTLKEVGSRFDFKGLECKIDSDKKAKSLTLWCSEAEKLAALNDVFQTKLIKRGLSILSFDYGKEEPASGRAARQQVTVISGISKEKAKEIIAAIKSEKLKVQTQIQDEQVRVTGKKRDDLQSVIQFLKTSQEKLKCPMEFGNFRD